MPTLSHRAQAVPASPIRKLAKFSNQAVEQGKEVIFLNIGQPDVNTPPEALEALKSFDQTVIGYSPSEGTKSMREALSNFYNRNKVYDSHPDDILVTVGGSEALSFTVSVLTDVGDEIITPEPFFSSYNSFAIGQGVKLVTIPSYLSEGFKMPKVEDFEKVITDKTKAILLCNPGNPAGNLYTKEELERIADLVIEKDIYLVADEVYREFLYGEQSHTSVLSIDKIKDRVVVIESMSKRFSMCGVRVGAMVTRNHDILAQALKFAQARLSPPTLGQYLSEVALNKVSAASLEEMRLVYQERRDFLYHALSQVPNIVTVNPSGAFYLMAELPVDDADKFAEWLLTDFAVDNRTVMVAPAAGFYNDKSLGKRQIRIAYVLELEKLKQAVDIITKGLEQYPGRI